MPELPEVEALRRTIARAFVGRRLLTCEVFWPRLIEPTTTNEFSRSLTGRRLRAVRRRGKYLILDFGAESVLAHLRLDGAFFEPTRSDQRLDAAFRFVGRTLAFRDPRHLARLRLLETKRISRLPALEKLGPEPLDRRLTFRRFRRLLASHRVPVKVLLMDQQRIAGLGNIYAAEALFRARIHPARPANGLGREEARRLFRAVVAVTRDAIEWCARELRNLRDIERWFVGLDKFVDVYGRAGEPCRRCRQPIRAVRLGGRTSYFCPRCQPRVPRGQPR